MMKKADTILIWRDEEQPDNQGIRPSSTGAITLHPVSVMTERYRRKLTSIICLSWYSQSKQAMRLLMGQWAKVMKANIM